MQKPPPRTTARRRLWLRPHLRLVLALLMASAFVMAMRAPHDAPLSMTRSMTRSVTKSGTESATSSSPARPFDPPTKPWREENVTPTVTRAHVELSLPSGYELREAELVLDDTSGESDTERPLLVSGQLVSGVHISTPSPERMRLDFELGVFRPGRNAFFVRATLTRGDDLREVRSPMQSVDYVMPETLGLSADGSFRLPKAQFPMRMADCRGAACKDRDGDGLNDLWENAAMHQLRPELRMDSGDQLFQSRDDAVRVLTQVTPLSRGDGPYVLFAHVVTFTRDYGWVLDHPGDTEAYGVLYRVSSSGTLHWVASVAKGHQCLLCGPEFAFHAQDFDERGVPLLFVEKDKHGLWQALAPCRDEALYRCRGDRALRPDAHNIGEPGERGDRALIDTFDDVTSDGPFAQLAGIFPGEAIWNGDRARVRGRFCGGRDDCSEGRSANLPGTVVQMIRQTFERGYLKELP